MKKTKTESSYTIHDKSRESQQLPAYRAYVWREGKIRHLGYYQTREEAAEVSKYIHDMLKSRTPKATIGDILQRLARGESVTQEERKRAESLIADLSVTKNIKESNNVGE